MGAIDWIDSSTTISSVSYKVSGVENVFQSMNEISRHELHFKQQDSMTFTQVNMSALLSKHIKQDIMS